MIKPIKCPHCGTLFGNENNGVLNIKHRDLFREIKGYVAGPCRGCGARIEWGHVPSDEADVDNSGTRPSDIEDGTNTNQ